jgi:hypothetical protein
MLLCGKTAGIMEMAVATTFAVSLFGCQDSGIGGDAELQVDQTSMQFLDVAVSRPRVVELNVSNAGRAGLLLRTVQVRSGAQSPFSVIGIRGKDGSVQPVPGFVGIGGMVSLLVQYSPATETARDSDILDLATNDPDKCFSNENPCEIQLNGTAAPPKADLEVICKEEGLCPDGSHICLVISDRPTGMHPERLVLNFCEVSRGMNREIDAVLRNAGNIPIHLSGVALDDPTEFRLLNPSTTDVTLEPATDLKLALLYAPSEEGAAGTGMDVGVDDPDVPDGLLKVRLMGVCAEPDIEVYPLNIPFAGVSQGGSSTQSIAVHNTGNGTLVVTALEVNGGSVPGEFAVDSTAGFDVDAGEQTSIQVTYAPKDASMDEGSVIIRSNDPDEPEVVVTLGADVRPDLEVTPSSEINFVDVPAGGTAQKDLVLRNVGHADLHITDMRFSLNPGAPPVYELSGLPGSFPADPIVLAPAESKSFQVLFTDDMRIKDEIGQIEISHNSTNDSNPYIVLARSTGTPYNLPPVAVVNPASLVTSGLNPVHLDGSGSYDLNAGDSVTRYTWSFLFLPQDPVTGRESQAVLTPSDAAQTTFTPDVYGKYVVRLQVFDSYNAMSQPADVEISVNR